MADESQTNDTRPDPSATAGSFDAFVGPHLPVLLRVAGSLCRIIRTDARRTVARLHALAADLAAGGRRVAAGLADRG